MPGDRSLPDQRLPRCRRILTTADFQKIKASGERMVLGGIIANWLPNELNHSRLGIIAPARIGKAHVRSRAKRLLRESFRLHQQDFSRSVDLVMVARNSIAGKSFPEVEQNFLTILKRGKLLRER